MENLLLALKTLKYFNELWCARWLRFRVINYEQFNCKLHEQNFRTLLVACVIINVQLKDILKKKIQKLL